jgi:hypothetical protein
MVTPPTPLLPVATPSQPSYSHVDVIERTEKLSGTYLIRGMLDSLQHGEGFPSMDEILNKRRAKIDDAAADDDAPTTGRATAGDSGDAPQPDLDYQPGRDVNPFLEDPDDEDDNNGQVTTGVVASDRSTVGRFTPPAVAADDDVHVHFYFILFFLYY